MKKLMILLMVFAGLTVMSEGSYTDPYSDTDYGTGALWHMDSESGGKILDDDSVQTDRDADLTLNGAVLVDPSVAGIGYPAGNAAFGNCLSFDGVDDNATIPHTGYSFDPANVRVEGWVKAVDAATTGHILLDRWNQMVIYLYPDKFTVLLWDGLGKTKYQTVFPENWDASAWNHFNVEVFDTEFKLYINGNLEKTFILDGGLALAPRAGYTWLGSRYTNRPTDGMFFKGYMDEFRVSEIVPVIPEYLTPYLDKWGTAGLWHFDEIMDPAQSGEYKKTADDDSENPGRNKDLVFYNSSEPVEAGSNNGAELVDPAEIAILSYPNDDPNFGKCLHFDGLYDSLRTEPGNNIQFDPDNFKVEAWVRLDDDFEVFGSGAAYWIFNQRNRLRLTTTDHATLGLIIGFTIWDADGDAYYPGYKYADLGINPQEWHHVEFSYYAGNVSFSVNGQILAARDMGAPARTPTTDITYIGCAYNGGSQFWGYMDEIRVSEAVETEPGCGYWGYQAGDLNLDCAVDLGDFAWMGYDWLMDSDLDSGADNPVARDLDLPGNYNVPAAAVTPTIDGIVSPGEWSDAKPVQMIYPDLVAEGNTGTLERLVGNPPTPEDFSLFWYLKWDASGLYVMGRVYDDIFSSAAGLDEPQITLNLYNNLDAVFLDEAFVWNLPANGSINVNGGLAAVNSVVAGSVLDDGYVVEFKFDWNDWTSINGGTAYVPQVNDVHGFGLTCQDHDEEGARQCVFNDYGSGTWSMLDLSLFNTITLVDTLASGEMGYYMTDLNQDTVVNPLDIETIADQWLTCTDPAGEGCINVKF
jgi:hypothetical protein